ncbi:MAG: DUF2809 domain-containing protein [Clostridia bacterium]|nr:DUF2809 domain-containing protein [Clostridia bacterium]
MVVTKIKKKLRIIYGVAFLLIFATEVFIALYVRDNFIRPYVGDMLVTVLICCFVRFFVPEKSKFAPLFVFLFSLLVEIGQYFDFVKLLGLDNNVLISTLLGRTFSVADIICYGIGCVVFGVFDYIIKKKF